MLTIPYRSLVFAATILVPLPVLHLDAQERQDVDSIALAMSNPTLPVMNITTFIDYTTFKGTLPGAGDQSSWTFLAQPPLPFPLSPQWSLIVRPAIPLLFNQPLPTPTGFQSAGVNLGNIGLDLLIAGGTPTGFLRGAGVVGTIPSATDERIRANWAVGPELLVGYLQRWGVLLLLVTQQFDVSGTDKTSRLGGQYVATFSLRGGWQIVSTGPFTYNWDTKNFTLPIGGGPFRTMMVGSTPVKLGLLAWYYVAQPDAFGPKWQLRFQVQPSFRRPW